jgi:endo-1,4-beta-D-glucanase Y
MSVAHGASRSNRAGRLNPASAASVAAVAAVILVVLGSVLLSSCSSPTTTSATTVITTDPSAMHLAATFLDEYQASDGRIVRRDQGLALAHGVATHDAARFASIWNWTKENLQQPSGLFAYRWSDGAIVGTGAATDADLDTAWALVLAARSFGDPTYETDGLAVASAVLANETVVSGGRLELVAGPWARNAPYSVDPSYFSPEAMAALAKASGDPRWTQLEANSEQVVSELQGGDSTRYLPPDWALLAPSGAISASSPPSGGEPPSYGLDAQRVPVWYAADCTASGRALSADDWSTIRGLAASGSYLAYGLTGAVQSTYSNDLGLVASAASADAAGQRSQGGALLAQAQSGGNGQTYYGNAWVALGTVLLTTKVLSPCPPAPAS